jgi:hypothetical protein
MNEMNEAEQSYRRGVSQAYALSIELHNKGLLSWDDMPRLLQIAEDARAIEGPVEHYLQQVEHILIHGKPPEWSEISWGGPA